jgi:RNA polymerase sigma-70 factor (ECF subfamily)
MMPKISRLIPSFGASRHSIDSIDFYRRNKQEYEYVDEKHAVKDDFVDDYERKKKVEKIERALTQLPPLDREIVILFHREEYSYQEIAEIVKFPVTTVKTRLHRARKKLQQLVRKDR